MGLKKSPVQTPKERGPKRIKKRNLSEPQASLFRFPFWHALFWVPEGRRTGVAFLCFLSLAKQRKEVARRGQSRQARPKSKQHRITEEKQKTKKGVPSPPDTPLQQATT
jgi:hypothetical protein